MLSYLKLMRPLNGVMSIIGVWIGSMMAGAALVPDINIVFGMISVFLISGGGMAINDFFDIEIDKLNRPHRPLPSGKISRRAALAFSGLLLAAGAAASYFIHFGAFIVAAIAALLLIAYAAQLKKTILAGNLVVSALVALTFVFGGIIVGSYAPVLPLALLAFLSNTAREIYKTIDDALGDRKYNVSSVAIRLGVQNARLLANVFLVIAVIFSFVPYFLGLLGQTYLFFVVLADIVFLSAAAAPVRYSSRLVKIAMLVALVAFFAGAYGLRI